MFSPIFSLQYCAILAKYDSDTLPVYLRLSRRRPRYRQNWILPRLNDVFSSKLFLTKFRNLSFLSKSGSDLIWCSLFDICGTNSWMTCEVENLQLFLMGLSFVFSLLYNWQIKFCPCWDSNRGPQVSEVIILPTVPQPLPSWKYNFADSNHTQ